MGQKKTKTKYKIPCTGRSCKERTCIDRYLTRGFSLFLILLLLSNIAGCGSKDNVQASLQSGKQAANPAIDLSSFEPEGPFLFYRQSDYGRTDYGLINEEGNIVLALEHDSLEALQPDSPKNQTYYRAGKYAYAKWLDDWILFYALVSPKGDVLTEYSYVYLEQYDKDRFVSISMKEEKTPGVQYLFLDSSGRESGINDRQILEEIENQGHYYEEGSWPSDFAEHQDEAVLRSGADIPKSGLEWTLDLNDGKYWGAYYGEPLTESPYEVSPEELLPDNEKSKAAGNIYDTNMSLFDDTGSLCSPYTYIYVEPLSDDVWIGTNWFYHQENDGYTMAYSLITPEGIPLNNQVYDYIWTESLSSGIVASSDDGILLLDPVTGEEQKIIYGNSSAGCSLAISGEKNLLIVDGDPQEETNPLAIDFDTGDFTDFTNFPGGTVTDVLEDGSRFILYSPRPFELDRFALETNASSTFAAPDVSDSGGRYFLTDESGNPLISYANYISYEKGFYCVTSFIPGQPVYPLSNRGLFDRNGNEILPCSFQDFTLLDGYAAYVQKGDSYGLIDLRGNWIYQESVYRTLQ